MHLAIVSKNPQKLEKHRVLLKKYLNHMDSRPDIILAVGGDGTYLAAERIYPGVPTLLVRDGSICNKCGCDNLELGLKSILAKKYHVVESPKISASFNDKSLEAVNDIVIRNIQPTHAIRFKISIDGKQLTEHAEEYIGDGIVVSTAFGSEGYFHSITGGHFEEGIGLAFNNTTNNLEPILLSPSSVITLELTRGIAHVAADNSPHIFRAKKGDVITIKQSDNVARIVRLK